MSGRHGNTQGPCCVHCGAPIYHTAPGDHWAHQRTGLRRCSYGTETVAEPKVIR